jgi:histidyl-tRNA synthetase
MRGGDEAARGVGAVKDLRTGEQSEVGDDVLAATLLKARAATGVRAA